MQPQPLIAVRDVEASSRWYQRRLGCRSSHGGAEYERLIDRDGRLVLQLHDWDAHEHPHMGDPAVRPYGNGVLLWFQIEDFTAAVARARALSAEILEGPQVNPNAQSPRDLAARPRRLRRRAGERLRRRLTARRPPAASRTA